jgi:hypothetical protein
MIVLEGLRGKSVAELCYEHQTERKPKPTGPNEWWDIDMLNGLVRGIGWV